MGYGKSGRFDGEGDEDIMYFIFTAQNVLYLKTWDEVEADTIAYQIDGWKKTAKYKEV